MAETGKSPPRLMSWLCALVFYGFAAGVTLVGLALLGLGGLLASKGGSVFYAASGLLLTASGVQLLRRRASALHLAVLNFAATWIWALIEVGLDGWALLPRVDVVCVLTALFFLPPIRGRLGAGRSSPPFARLAWGYLALVLLTPALVATLVAVNASRAAGGIAATTAPRTAAAAQASDWRHIGQDLAGTRFSTLSTIDRGNVGGLKQVWDHVEPASTLVGGPLRKDQAAPLQVGDKLFVCLADNTVVALDAEDGKVRWRHDPKVDLTGVKAAVCRGVAYHEDAAAAQCPKRLIVGTLDARLIALDAETGRRCEDFGQHGEVSLKTGMGPFEPGMYSVTSPPTIVRGVAVVGGLVMDNVSVGEPSGVVRAYDVRTGALVWAWDMGRPATETGEPATGTSYTRGTPNAWSIFSADEQLGLVYLPLGNATPDFVGGHRDAASEKYASSVVAIDAATGQVRWSFQTVRHDLWDYDVSAQPVLFDMPTAAGVASALLAAGKHGELFVLDRRTGEPLTPVAEKAVSKTDVAGEWTAKTQPFSVGMPNLGGPPLREADMWGVTPFDQLWCRLQFRKLRYEGMFTPPSLRGSLQYPGVAGGVDWGSATVDSGRQVLFAPSFRLATVIKLIPRAEAEKGVFTNNEQAGTPYELDLSMFLTKLGVPCQRPPFGLLTAIDLKTRKVLWSKPLGTAEELGPRGVASRLPLTIGAAPMVGGAITTAGDVLFIGATGDRRLRAIDSLTGRELWSDKLPQGNQATPVTYRAPRSGRQMVVFVSGGYATLGAGPNVPTHVVAYALP